MSQYFKVSKKAARKAIQYTKPYINTSAILPIIEYVFIEVSKGGVRFSATNLSSYILHNVETIEHKGEFSFCIHVRHLEWFCNKAMADEITFTYETNVCKMESGGFTVNVITEKSENFVKAPVMDSKSLIFDSLYETNFADELQKALKFISYDELRPAMTGVSLKEIKGNLVVAATDAHRLFHKKIYKIGYEGFSLILDKQFAQGVANIFKGTEYTVQTSTTHAQAYNDDTVLFSRLIDARYPDYTVVLPKNIIEARFDRKKMMEYLNCALPFANGYTKMITALLYYDKFSLSTKEQHYTCESSYELPTRSKGDFTPFRFAFNGYFMMDCLSISKEPEVLLEYPDKNNRGITIDKHCLLMPLMINDND